MCNCIVAVVEILFYFFWCNALVIMYTCMFFTLRTLMPLTKMWFLEESALLSVVCLRTCVHHTWISKQQWNNTVEVLVRKAVCGTV